MSVESVELEVKALREEVKTLQSEIHLLQRQQSSRKGPEGGRGPAGRDGRDGVDGKPGRDGASITKAEATEIIRDLVQRDKAFVAALGEIAMQEFKKRILPD